MRWILIPILACAVAAPALADDIDDDVHFHDGDRVTSRVTVDPVTGAKTTTTTTIRRYTDIYPTYGYTRVVGAPVVVSQFPLNPYDGQIAVVNGRTYKWDADDAEWEDED